jgi:hypothetical protein
MGQQDLALGLCFCAAPVLEIKCRPISSDAAARHHDRAAAHLAAHIAALIAAHFAALLAAIA